MPEPILLMVRELAVGGGCERDLTKLALTIDRTRFEPHVACFHEGYRAEEIRAAGVPVSRFNVRSFRDRSLFTGISQYRRYVTEKGIRLVHAYDLPTSIFVSIAGRLSRTPVIVTSHLGHRELVSTKDRMLGRLSDRLSHRIVVNCDAMRQNLVQDENVAERKIFLSYNGFMPSVFHPARSPQERWRPPQFTPQDLLIGTVCVLRLEKNIPLLLRSFADLRRMQPSVPLKLLVVGSGALEQELQVLAAELGIAADTTFVPARQDVERWYRALDIFVLPSFSEAFPNAVLEAMASGCATVATRVGGIPELITHGETGLLFENRSQSDLTAQLHRLVGDPALRAQLGANASHLTLSRFTMQHYCDRMETFYSDLLSG